jgi:hypothetical protein
MPYTVWSRGRLVGHSELDYKRVFARHRMGDFYPTAVGLKLMPIATGVSPAGIDLARMIQALPNGPQETKSSANSLDGTLRQTSEYADLIAAENHRDALALELRGPGGRLIPTEWIDIRDTEFLLSLAREEDLDDSAVDFECGEEWRGQEEFPRYQLQVMLHDCAVNDSPLDDTPCKRTDF